LEGKENIMRGLQWTCFAAAMFLMVTAGRAQAEAFSWRGSLSQGGILTIRGVRGDIVATPSQSGQIEIVGKKSGSGSDLEAVAVRVVEEAGKVTICTVYPGNDRCPGGRDERRDGKKNNARIDFTVRVPAGVHLVADTEIGRVEAKSLTGPVEARTVLGDIDISTSAYAQASSVNGDILASLGSTQWSGSVEFETVNGNILVRLPRKGDTELRAKSATGQFETLLFPTPKDQYGAHIPGADFSGTLGSGGRMLKITTTNGSIRLEPTS
jgi:putative adhesin